MIREATNLDYCPIAVNEMFNEKLNDYLLVLFA